MCLRLIAFGLLGVATIFGWPAAALSQIENLCPGPNANTVSDSPYNFTFESWKKKIAAGRDAGKFSFGRCIKNMDLKNPVYIQWGKKIDNEIGPDQPLKVYLTYTGGDSEDEKAPLRYGARLKELSTEVIKPKGSTDYVCHGDCDGPSAAQFDPKTIKEGDTLTTFIQVSVPIFQVGRKVGYMPLRMEFQSTVFSGFSTNFLRYIFTGYEAQNLAKLTNTQELGVMNQIRVSTAPAESVRVLFAGSRLPGDGSSVVFEGKPLFDKWDLKTGQLQSVRFYTAPLYIFSAENKRVAVVPVYIFGPGQ